MPQTVKLSRRFYERFGDDLVNELVGLLNQVDATYKSELRDQNEINFARFDAKVEQRFAESRAEMDRRFAESRAEMDKRFAESRAEMDKRFAELRVGMNDRFGQVDQRFAKLEARFDGLLDKMDGMDRKFATKEDLQRALREQTHMFFAAWGVLVASSIALWFR